MHAGSLLESQRSEAEHGPKREDCNRIDAVPRVAEVRSGGLDEIVLFLDGDLEWQVKVEREGGLAGPFSRVHDVRVDPIQAA